MLMLYIVVIPLCRGVVIIMGGTTERSFLIFSFYFMCKSTITAAYQSCQKITFISSDDDSYAICVYVRISGEKREYVLVRLFLVSLHHQCRTVQAKLPAFLYFTRRDMISREFQNCKRRTANLRPPLAEINEIFESG